MNAPEMSRVYGYIRASTDKQIASPETQRQIIEDYARRLGRSVDRFFVDPGDLGQEVCCSTGRPARNWSLDPRARVTRSLWRGSIGSAARFVGFARILSSG